MLAIITFFITYNFNLDKVDIFVLSLAVGLLSLADGGEVGFLTYKSFQQISIVIRNFC